MKQQHKIRYTGEVSEVQLTYKSKVKATDRPQIGSQLDSVAFFRQHWNPDTIELQEEMKVAYLNRAHRILGLYPASIGSITGTTVDSRLILLAGIRLGATSLILCHNHPSGTVNPSKADCMLTQKVKEAALLLDMNVVDHIILTKDSYFSFAYDGLL